MIYCNEKTGAVVRTNCKISGEHWKLVEEPAAEDTKAEALEEPAAKTSRKGKK